MIWASNHAFKDDVAGSIVAASRHAYILFGSIPQFYNTFDGIAAYLNGVVMINRKSKINRSTSVDRASKILRQGTDLLIFPEGVWNKTSEKLLLNFWPGIYRISKETGAWVVPIIHYIKDPTYRLSNNPIHTVVDDAVRLYDMSEHVALEYLREIMGTWYYLMMEKYGKSTREEELSGFSDSCSAWEDQLAERLKMVERYDREIELCADYRSNGSVSYKRAEIDKRQTNKDDKEDVVYCTIFGEGEYANQNIECIMYYTYYDKGGWQFENIEITNSTIESGSLRGPDADIYATEIINDPLNYLDEDLKDDNGPDVINAEYEDDFLYEENLEWELVISFDMQKTTSLGYTVSGRVNIDYYYDISSDMWYEYDSNYAIDNQAITGLEGTWIPDESGRYSGEIYILTKNEDGTYNGTCIYIGEEYEGGYSFIETEDGIYQGDNGNHYKGVDKIIDNIDVIENTFHLRDARGMSYVTGGFGWDAGTFGIWEGGHSNRYKKVESN